MEGYGVKLEIFEGPLDLLLYLIKKEDMDIRDIQISKITQEYLDYLQLMKDLDLEVAGEFLVLASTLMEIKAKSLLPARESETEGEEGPDPQAELVARLLEYQKYKEAAHYLAERESSFREIYYRNVMPQFAEEDYHLEATLFDLLGAFRDVLKSAGGEVKELLYEEIPLEQKIRELLDLLERAEPLHFQELFAKGKSRREWIVTFLALLELVRLKQVIAKQSEAFGEIRIYRISPSPESSPLKGEEITFSPSPLAGEGGDEG